MTQTFSPYVFFVSTYTELNGYIYCMHCLVHMFVSPLHQPFWDQLLGILGFDFYYTKCYIRKHFIDCRQKSRRRQWLSNEDVVYVIDCRQRRRHLRLFSEKSTSVSANREVVDVTNKSSFFLYIFLVLLIWALVRAPLFEKIDFGIIFLEHVVK